MNGLHSKFARLFVSWLPLAVAITLISGLIYVTVQQNYRISANDPQIQMAEDAAASLESGAEPQLLVGSAKVDMAQSLAPYMMVFDESGTPLASSAVLDGKTPILPDGVFEYTKKYGEDRITWQPRSDARSAAVITHFGGSRPGFVLAGRSLREVEIRESQLTNMVGIAWIITLLGTLTVNAFSVWILQK